MSKPNPSTKKAKRRTPLQALWKGVKVWSCADGRFRITPTWQPQYKPVGGVLTRMYAARHLQRVLDSYLKGSK